MRQVFGSLHRAYQVVPSVSVEGLERRLANDRRSDAHAVSGGHVDDGVLEQCGEHEQETHDHPDVDRLDVGDARQGLVDAGALRGRRQYGQETDGDAGGDAVDVDPERHPRQDDGQDARNEDLDDEVADVSLQYEHNFRARIGT